MNKATFLQATMATMTFQAFERHVNAGGLVVLRKEGRNFVVEYGDAAGYEPGPCALAGGISLLATATDAALVME